MSHNSIGTNNGNITTYQMSVCPVWRCWNSSYWLSKETSARQSNDKTFHRNVKHIADTSDTVT